MDTAQAYYQVQTFTSQIGDQTVEIISKPGIPHWNEVSAASRLLAQACDIAQSAQVLLLGCGHGALGVALARRSSQGSVVLSDPNSVALAMATRTLQANQIGNARVVAENELALDTAYDTIIIEAPKDRKLTRRWLAQAHATLPVGGQLLIAGANDQGIRSAIADTEALFGNAHLLAYKQGNRVAHARKSAHSHQLPTWANEAGVAPGTWYSFNVQIRNQHLHIQSIPGVFAYNHVDAGTAFLIDTLSIPSGTRVLDVGCGYGLIGLMAMRLGAAAVDMLDVNTLAVASARENIRCNIMPNVQVSTGDGMQDAKSQYYDVVVTNPPFHVGGTVEYAVAHAFIAEARRILKPGGQFVLVANQFIRYEHLLQSVFAHVKCLASNRSYRVWNAA